ncbi:3-oxoacyl-(acyl-carrier-protein) synthase III [Bacillus sp. OxB-1]|nr:3-oxoacyl-(acyl-carrier-protein) synthase III [Bacillus sp. OxB-1]
MTVGIVSTGVYIPETVMTAEEIAEQSGLPVDIVKTKMGILQKLITPLRWGYGLRRRHCEKGMSIRKPLT